MKRILAGPVTIILVYADWCGHCHEFMPKFKSMIKSPNRTTQVASIENSMEKQVHEALQKNNSNVKPMIVKGYPSVNAVDMQGNFIKEIPRESVKTVLNTGGPLAEQSISSPQAQAQAQASPQALLEESVPNAASAQPLEESIPNAASTNQTTLQLLTSPQPPKKNNTKKANSLEGITFVSKVPEKMVPSINHMGSSLYKKLIGGLRKK
jgi:thiol-disulfide isomerase/thioredoxin